MVVYSCRGGTPCGGSCHVLRKFYLSKFILEIKIDLPSLQKKALDAHRMDDRISLLLHVCHLSLTSEPKQGAICTTHSWASMQHVFRTFCLQKWNGSQYAQGEWPASCRTRRNCSST